MRSGIGDWITAHLPLMISGFVIESESFMIGRSSVEKAHWGRCSRTPPPSSPSQHQHLNRAGRPLECSEFTALGCAQMEKTLLATLQASPVKQGQGLIRESTAFSLIDLNP